MFGGHLDKVSHQTTSCRGSAVPRRASTGLVRAPTKKRPFPPGAVRPSPAERRGHGGGAGPCPPPCPPPPARAGRQPLCPPLLHRGPGPHRPGPALWVGPARGQPSRLPALDPFSSSPAARPWRPCSASASASSSSPPPRRRAAWSPTTCCTRTGCGRTSPGTGDEQPSCCSAPCTATRGCGRLAAPAALPAAGRRPSSAGRRGPGPGRPHSSGRCCSALTAYSTAWGAGWAPRLPPTTPASPSAATSSGGSPTTTSKWPSSRWGPALGAARGTPGWALPGG